MRDGKTLNEMLKWPLKQKTEHAIYRFLEYYIFYRGKVYLSFSGGKDSQVLNWIISEIFKGRWKHFVEVSIFEIVHEYGLDYKVYNYKSIIEDKLFGGPPPNVFCDTGLEFQEIRKHVKTFENTVWMKPKMKFTDVIVNIGVAVGTKQVAMQIRRLRSMMLTPSDKNAATRRLYSTGIKKDGTKSKHLGLPKFWQKGMDAPFKISDKCCDIFKKEPFQRYEKETGRKPITATNVEESLQRRASWLKTGCNSFGEGSEMSRPMSIWTDENVWQFANLFNLRFAEVYYDKMYDWFDGEKIVEVLIKGIKRTGCMFCLFGIHLEPKNELNRFQRMAITHPKQYAFMISIAPFKMALDFFGIKYLVTKRDFVENARQGVLEFE